MLVHLQMFLPSPWGRTGQGCAWPGGAQPQGQPCLGHMGKGHHCRPCAAPELSPLGPPGEEGMNVSCQAESYHGSFHCSWNGPRSAVFRARLTRRWVPQGPPDLGPAPWLPSPHACLPPTAMALWGSGCRQPAATAGSAPASQTPPSVPSPRSCAHCSYTWRGSRTPPISTSPSTSSSATSVSLGRWQWGQGSILGLLEALWECLAPGPGSTALC